MDTLDAEVRRVDEDRWLASRFASAPVRDALTAIYAFNHEVARTADVVSEAAIGDIRLTWWREAIAEIYERHGARLHPVVIALANAVRNWDLPRAPLEALIEARRADLEAEPFTTWEQVETYIDGTAGNVLRLALKACGSADAPEAFVVQAARAWGFIGLLRAREQMAAQGRSLLLRDAPAAEALVRVTTALDAARVAMARLPASAFPAAGYIALSPAYTLALKEGRAQLSLLSRQFRMVRAAATGGY